MQQANQVFFLTFLLIAIGYLVKRLGLVTASDGRSLSKFIMSTTFPALMLVSTYEAKIEPKLLLIPLLCVLLSVTMLAIAWMTFAKLPNFQRGLMVMGVGGMNMGMFAFPIIEGLFGKAAMTYAVMFDIGNTFMIFCVVYPIGIYFSEQGESGMSWQNVTKKVFRSLPVWGMIIGIGLNVMGVELSESVLHPFKLMASSNKAFVLMMMGVFMSFALSKSELKLISKVLLIRCSLGLLAAFLLYFFLPADAPLLRNTLVLCVIVPLGMTILPFANELNYNPVTAGTMLNLSLLVSFLLMWAMVLGLGLVGS